MVGDMLRKAANKQASPGSPMTDFTPETEVSKEVCSAQHEHCLPSILRTHLGQVGLPLHLACRSAACLLDVVVHLGAGL